MNNDIEPAIPQGKISVGSTGLGAPSVEDVEKRALELAKADGRTEINEGDVAAAREDLVPQGEIPAPELGGADQEAITDWDEAASTTGTHVPNVGAEDEANIGEVLVEEGLAEADHDVRVTAAEEFPPEEE